MIIFYTFKYPLVLLRPIRGLLGVSALSGTGVAHPYDISGLRPVEHPVYFDSPMVFQAYGL